MTLVQPEPCGCELRCGDGYVDAWMWLGCEEREPVEPPTHPRPSWAHHPLPWGCGPGGEGKVRRP